MIAPAKDRNTSSAASSFQISDELRIRLEAAERESGKCRDWILNQALREYLDRLREDALAVEARRQSLVASGRTALDARFWTAQADERDWI